MKIITYKTVVQFICLLNYLLILAPFHANAQEWCWTKSMANEPSYVFNPKNGGINWGYCKSGMSLKQIKYKISVITSSLTNSGTDSQLKVQLFGSRGLTNEKVLSSNLESGSKKLFEIEDKDIGDINKISIKIEGTTGYRCKYIRVSTPTTYRNFQCLKRIEPCKNGGSNFSCIEEMLPEGDSSYKITLKSSNEMDRDLTSPILINLIGENGISNQQMFSENGIKIGSQITNSIKVKDIGKATGFKLAINEQGKFKGAYMIISNIKTGEVSQFDIKEVSLENPGNNSYTYDPNPVKKEQDIDNNPKSTGGFKKLLENAENIFDNKEENNEEDDGVTSIFSENSESESPSSAGLDMGASGESNMNNPEGGLMEDNEKREIIDLDCSQKLVNPDTTSNVFGPSYPTPNINYMRVLARCPSNCHRVNGIVYGRGIHPDISPICLSALIDRSISEYGGIISISIFPGLDKYLIPEIKTRKTSTIKVMSYFGKPQKSYSVAKVDNVDLCEKDLRIVDSKGKYSHQGRVEMRINGRWGTVCNTGNNDESAKRICKDLGYNDGKWAFKDVSQGSCGKYKGENYCGSEDYEIFYANINCNNSDKSINTCTKKYANPIECAHANDAIIVCTSKTFDGDSSSSSNGTVMLEKVIKNDNNVIGKLMLNIEGIFNPVCKNGFSSNAAQVACKQMGFNNGQIISPDPDLKLTGDISNNSPFSATEVKCNGMEKKLMECNLKTNEIDCTHDLDVILKCDGNNGDYSGKSQRNEKTEKEFPPALGKLSAVKIKASCDTTGRDKKFRGDAGSLYIVKCPSNCKDFKGNVFGTGLYTLDSHVCLAAIHSGIISDKKGGSFAFIKTWGQKYYQAKSRNEIVSTEFIDNFPVSFTLSSLNSQWKNMWKLWKKNSVGVYLETASNLKLIKENKSFLSVNTSFMEMEIKNTLGNKESTPTPVFEWIQTDPSQSFNDKSNGSIILSEHTMKPMNRYHIIIQATLTDFKNKKAFLFSFSGCKGFNIYLNESATIMLGDVCSEDHINTGLQFPINDKVIISAFYDDGNLKIALFTQSMTKPLARVINKINEIGFGNNVGIGFRADTKEEFFFGYIDFVLIFQDEVKIKNIQKIIDYVDNKVKKPVSFELKETVDNRSCISSCFSASIPGSPNSPQPPKEADPYNSDIFNMPDNLLDGRLNIGTRPTTSKKICSNGDSENNENQNSESRNESLNDSVSSNNETSQESSQNSNFLSHSSSNQISESSSSLSSQSSLSQSAQISSSNSAEISSNLSSQSSSNHSAQNSSSHSAQNSSSYLSQSSSSSSSSSYSSSISSQSTSSIINSSQIGYVQNYGTYDRSELINIESIELDCFTNLKDERFSGSPGKSFRVKCPSCMMINRPIYGSFIYHPLSSICKAANHAGVLNNNPGYIIVEILPGKKIYNGSIGNGGILSGTFGSARISFRTKIATPPSKVSCSESANSDKFLNASIGTKFVVFCPENCSKAGLKIFGSEVYADMSPICLSAIHNGIIGDHGGEIEFLIEGAQTFFKGTKGFGIVSHSRENYNRSFRFLGQKSGPFFRYEETFKGSIIDRWEINPEQDSFNPQSDSWNFTKSIYDIMSIKKELFTITHKGSIRAKQKDTFGSIITLKKSNFSNGKFKANVIFKDQNSFALLFRYNDKNSYYGVEFLPKEERNNVRLISKIDGSSNILESETIGLFIERWYRIKIVLNGEKVKVFLQNENIRENKPIFTAKIDALARGKIGFAINGNDNVSFAGIKIEELSEGESRKYDPNNRRSFNYLLKHLHPKERKVFCKKFYDRGAEDISRCGNPFTFCKLKCDEEVSSIENILNFKCIRDCNKAITSQINIFRVQKREWMPKINEKIDFNASSEEKYVPANVISKKTKITSGKLLTMLTIQYKDNKGSIIKVVSEFPSSDVQKCGDMLERRSDCLNDDN